MPGPKDVLGITRRTAERLQEAYRLVKRLRMELARAREIRRSASKRPQPFAFAKTREGGGYPANLDEPGSLVYEIEFVSRTFAETTGEATPTDAVWTQRFRKALTLRKTKGFPVGTLCVVYRIGKRLYIDPIEGGCDMIPVNWSDIEGYDPEEDQMLVKYADQCPKWVTMGDC